MLEISLFHVSFHFHGWLSAKKNGLVSSRHPMRLLIFPGCVDGAVRHATPPPRLKRDGRYMHEPKRFFNIEGTSARCSNWSWRNYGTLNHHVVRYVLHRFFASKHGWFIRGLEPDGDHRDDATDDSHALTNVQEWVPSYLQKFLEQLNQGKGLSMREVAVSPPDSVHFLFFLRFVCFPDLGGREFHSRSILGCPRIPSVSV